MTSFTASGTIDLSTVGGYLGVELMGVMGPALIAVYAITTGAATGAVVTAITAYLSVHFLVRYFQARALTPSAIYCLVFGTASILCFAF